MAGRIEVRVDPVADPRAYVAARTAEDGTVSAAGQFATREVAESELAEAYPDDLVVFIDDPDVEP